MNKLCITLDLWPPSVNTIYRNVHGRTLISKRGRQFYADGCARLGMYVPLEGRLAVDMKLYPPDRRKRDLDNHIKGLWDLLTKVNVWHDDSQVDEFHVSRETIVPKGRVEIHIWQLKAD